MDKLNTLFKIAQLIAKQKTGNLSVPENDLLKNWIAENPKNEAIYQKLQNEDFIANELDELEKFDAIKAFEIVNRKIENEKGKSFKLIPNYLKYAAAIAIIAVSSYFVVTLTNKTEKPEIAQSTIYPGNQKAILITGKNQQIVLDSSATKQVIKEDQAEITNSGNTLFYNSNITETSATQKTEYNTLITPRGGEYTLVLSDGTRVMLNSGSKLIYPVVFNGELREVELEGEAFFKVTKSTITPFIVKANHVNVTVYGTEFNVFAYENENEVQTTLIEGSVGVNISNRSHSESKIKPGQQLTFDKNSGNINTQEVNTDQYIAWTKGLFVFDNEPIENILKIMSRWYDFEYKFKENALKNQRFTLSLGRYDNISKILDMVSLSSNLKFTIQANKITIESK